VSVELPVEQFREVCLEVGDDPLQEVEYFLGGQLHDLATQVDDPDHLLLLAHNLLADAQQPLAGVVHELIVLQHPEQVDYLDVADSVHHHRVLVQVLAAHPVLVHPLYLCDLARRNAALCGGTTTS
jgi:hypothetical protein